jgi:transcriptional regulator with XRE-family HTH domain
LKLYTTIQQKVAKEKPFFIHLKEKAPKMDNIHNGEIVEKILRNSSFPLRKIAKALNMSRTTLYKYFQEEELSYKFLFEVGKIIGSDLSQFFPGLKSEFDSENQNTVLEIERKYKLLRKRFRRVLAITKKVAKENKSTRFGQELEELEKYF